MFATSEHDVTRDSRVTISVSHAGSHAPVTESRPVPSRPVPKSVVGVVFGSTQSIHSSATSLRASARAWMAADAAEIGGGSCR